MYAPSKYELTDRLCKPKNLVMRKVDDFYMALSPDLPNIMVMDEVGKRFFELCDKNLTIGDIVEQILEERKDKTSRDELFSFISSMLDANFLFLKPPLPLQKVERSLDKLKQLYIHMTRACNLGCKHCYVDAGEPQENELTTKEALELIDDFARLGGEQLIITGGEPFLRREMLYEVLRKAKEAGISKVSIETNGTMIFSKDVDMCKKYDVELGVSLDGVVPETNDHIRGKGSFEKTIQTIRMLVNAGVRVKIGMTLMKPNFKEAKEMIYLAKDLGVNSTSFTSVREIGRAGANKNLLLSLEEIYSTIVNVWRKAREIGVSTQLEEQFKSLEKLTKIDMCGVGTGLLLISPNGDVYPCNMFLDYQEFKAGNIRKQRLEDIWKNSEVLKAFRHLSVLNVEGCKDCDLKFVCGVCVAEIYREHGDFSEKSSFCSLYKRICWIFMEELARKMWNE